MMILPDSVTFYLLFHVCIICYSTAETASQPVQVPVPTSSENSERGSVACSESCRQITGCTDVCQIDPEVSFGDYGRVVQFKAQRSLTDSEKYSLLTNHFIPSSTYKFPSCECGKQRRYFQHSWLTCYNDLVYSEHDCGAIASICSLWPACLFRVKFHGHFC